MKTLSIDDAQSGLRRLVSEAEPFVITDGSEPVAVLVKIDRQPSDAEAKRRNVAVLPLKQVLSDSALRAAISDDALCIISTEESTFEKGNWWEELQRIDAGQKARGFVGSVAEIDRSDEGYEERMREIYKHTTSNSDAG